MLDEIRHCILATDLVLFFENRPKLQFLIDNNEFDWKKKKNLWVINKLVQVILYYNSSK